MRAEREAAKIRQDGIADALSQVIGDSPSARYRRMLPENDREGDLVDDWDALVRRISRLCGAEIDSAEVAAGLRALLAAGAGSARGEKGGQRWLNSQTTSAKSIRPLLLQSSTSVSL